MSLSAGKSLTASMTPLLLMLGGVPLAVIVYDNHQTSVFERRCTASYEAAQSVGPTRKAILFVYGPGAARLPKPNFAQMHVRDQDDAAPGAARAVRLLTCTVTADGTVAVRPVDAAE